MAEVDILLATYNGQQYVAAQLRSLLMQSFTDFRVLVHDDGSTDATLDIIRAIARTDSRIVIVDDGLRFGSPQKNFMHLLSLSSSPWIMFCDQDDIWFDNKVEMMLREARRNYDASPMVVYSESYFWIPEKGIVGVGGAHRSPRTLREFLAQKAGVQGCASLFNKELKEIMLRFSGEIAMHDHLLEMAALTFGKVVRLEIPLMLYRQHTSNVTGNSDLTLSRFSRLKRKLIHPRPTMDARHLQATADFFSNFSESMTPEHHELFRRFLAMTFKAKLPMIMEAAALRLARDQSRLKLILKLLISPYLSEQHKNQIRL